MWKKTKMNLQRHLKIQQIPLKTMQIEPFLEKIGIGI